MAADILLVQKDFSRRHEVHKEHEVFDLLCVLRGTSRLRERKKR
jgi:hypothetical protein